MELEINGETFEAEVADSLLKRAWGLSLRKDGKMLFKFPRPVRAKIDMALLSEPLHLYFFDSEKKLIQKVNAEPWGWNPKTWNLYSPGKKYQYLLESFEDLRLEEGDELDLS